MESTTFRTIFPKYADLGKKEEFHTNQNIELFIKDQLPYQVEMVRKMESTFNSFLNQYTNLIIKRPQMSNLSYSLSSKATELLDKHFKEYEIKYQKVDKETFNSLFEEANPRKARELFREKFADIEALVKEKYIDNQSICRFSEEEIVLSLYSLIELYYFIKGDLVTIASKHQFVDSKVAYKTFKNETVEVDEIADSIILENGFTDYIGNIVNKRCRPFTNKRDFFNSKFKEITKEVESKVEPNLTIFLDSLVSKERHRITKVVVPKIQAILKNIGEIPEEKNCREIMEKVESMKKKFMGIKNNSYYFDIIRGNFNEKYKMELDKIENLYYLNNLEKYLQDVFQFMEELLVVEEEIIENRKSFTRTLSKKVEDQIFIISNPDNETIGIKLQSLIYDYFERLKDSCYRAENQEENSSKINSRAEQLKFEREERERSRREEQEKLNKIRKEKEDEERVRRQEIMAEASRKKQEEEDRKREEREQIEKERIKRLELENAERKRREEERQRIEDERKRKEQDEERKRKEKVEAERQERQEREKKEEEKRKADELQREKEKELETKRQLEMKRKKEQEEETKREEEQRRKKQAELDEQNRRQEEERKKEQEEANKIKQKQEEEERRQKEENKRKELEEQKRKNEQEKREQEEKRIADEKRKEEDRKREEERKKQEAKRKQEEEEMRLEEERKIKEQQKKKQEEEEKARKEAELQKKKEEEQRKKEEEQRKKEEEQKKKEEEQRKKEEEKVRQEEERKKELENKKKAEEQKRINEEKERKERELLEKELREEEERKKKEASLKAGSKKNEPPKKSAVTYGDYDDELIDEDDDLRKPTQIKSKEDQYVQEYDDDFDDFSPEKDGEEGENPIEPKKLIEIEQVKCLNDYLKGTSYARKNKPNIENFNNQNQYLYIFEEFIQNHKLFIYDHSIAKAILDFSAQLQDESMNDEDLKLTLETIKEEIDGSYAKQLDTDEFDPNTKLVFPFSFENDLNIHLIEVFLPIKHIHFVFGTEPEETEESQEIISSLVEAFLHLYEFEEPQVTQSVLPEESKAIVDIYKGELPNLLILFVKHYEQTLSPEEPIIINQYTVERFFYISHALSPLYEAIENENEQLTEFYSQIAEKYSADEKNRIVFAVAQTSNENYQEILEELSKNAKEDFLNGKMVNCLVCFQLEMIDEENEEDFEKLNIYMSLSRDSKIPKPVLNYFIVYKHAAEQEDQSQIFEIISSDMDDEFETNVYMDYTRHNGLSEYSEWMLPLWAHTTQKRKMSPDQAFRALTLSMTPLYVAYKQWD